MIDQINFPYTHEQWNPIRTVVLDRLGLDADLIESQYGYREVVLKQFIYTSGAGSLRFCLETTARSHILRCTRESQTPEHKAGIKQLIALRKETKALPVKFNKALASINTAEGARYRSMVPLVERYRPMVSPQAAIVTLVSIIDACIAAHRPQPTANARKAGRDRFWNEMLAIWISIGGEATGIAPAEFLVATSEPVFDIVRAIGGDKTMASMPQDLDSVVEWLRLCAKARKATTS